METEKRREPREESPEQSASMKESGSSSALLNLVNHSQNSNEVDKKTLAANLMLLLQLPPEKLMQLTSSMEKNILNGLIIKIKLLVNSVRLSFDRSSLCSAVLLKVTDIEPRPLENFSLKIQIFVERT